MTRWKSTVEFCAFYSTRPHRRLMMAHPCLAYQTRDGPMWHVIFFLLQVWAAFWIVIFLWANLGRRGRVLLTGIGLIGPLAYFFGPLALELFMKHTAQFEIVLGIGLLLAIIITLCVLVGLDMKDNRRIRAGSVDAFNKRVEDYFKLGYSRKEAIEITTRIRDEEKVSFRSRLMKLLRDTAASIGYGTVKKSYVPLRTPLYLPSPPSPPPPPPAKKD
jgi:hypothetical protein